MGRDDLAVEVSVDSVSAVIRGLKIATVKAKTLGA
jgi:hypothetical protein